MTSKRAEKQRRRKHRLERRRRRIAYRLREIQWEDQPRPMFTGRAIQYDVADRTQATTVGGIGAVHRLVQQVGLADEIDRRVALLKRHAPYYESDHVLNIAYNLLSGGQCLDDLERLRHDETYIRALGAQRIPDPTTAGDFCRRFDEGDIVELMQAINESRLRVWQQQDDSFFDEAILDADGTIVPTYGHCKEGADFSYKGHFGYHVLAISLSQTQEPLFLVNRPGNRPSHEQAPWYFDRALELCRRAGFRQITLRGDTDFSLTDHFDRWAEEGVRFLFGFDARSNLVERAKELPARAWKRLQRQQDAPRGGAPRARPENLKEQIVEDRDFQNIRLQSEWVAELYYMPIKCKQAYRMVVARKELDVMKGQGLLYKDERYFFYITNIRDLEPWEVVAKANQRCNQENLIEQLKNGARALSMPVNTLLSNWAYMVMGSLAWTLKAWFALLLPENGRWRIKYQAEKTQFLLMEFRQFVREVMLIPAQVVHQGRRIILRLLAWTRQAHMLLRVVEILERPLRC